MNDLQQWFAADILSLGMAADAARRASGAGSVVTYQRVHTVTADGIAAGEPVPDAASEVRLLRAARRARRRSRSGSRSEGAGGRAARERVLDGADRGARRGRMGQPGGCAIGAGRCRALGCRRDARRSPAGPAARPARADGCRGHAAAHHRLAAGRRAEAGDCSTSIRACLQAVGRPIHVSPLPRHAPADKPTTGYEDLRMVALARLALAADAQTPVRIEVDWSLYGPKLAQVALTFGADHLDAVAATTRCVARTPAGNRRGCRAQHPRGRLRAAGGTGVGQVGRVGRVGQVTAGRCRVGKAGQVRASGAFRESVNSVRRSASPVPALPAQPIDRLA